VSKPIIPSIYILLTSHARDEFPMFLPFLKLPTRDDLPDYYKVVSNPIDLTSLRKRIRGVRGKQAATGISEFKTWAAFEEEASYLWRNAFHYNEDGSDIFVLAKELQVSTKCLLRELVLIVPSLPSGNYSKRQKQLCQSLPVRRSS
jgi:hypothetical protein